jgi:hypothetical protein
MSGQWRAVIPGRRLREYLLEHDPGLAARIDPDGMSVVVLSRLIDNGAVVRAIVLLKLVNRQTPAERLLDIPIDAWTRITDQVWDGGSDVRLN